MTKPPPRPVNTQPAHAARKAAATKRRHQKWAAEMQAGGWLCIDPKTLKETRESWTAPSTISQRNDS